MKICNTCKENKPLEEYGKDSSRKDGLDFRCKECRKVTSKRYYEEHSEEHHERTKRWVEKNKERYRKLENERTKTRRKNDPTFRISKIMRQHLHRLINEYSKDVIEKEVGYTSQELRKHIENQWDAHMNWDNYGILWEIDHKKSFKSFFEEGETRSRVINSLDNLRPLEVSKNRKKGSKNEL
jgi:hypothetical protein